jgi:DNA mismatch repair protein MutS
MMAQYHRIKAQHPDAILLFRMGDFYEMFYEDAEVASRVLGLTLTSRDKGQEDAVPLAGIPWHSADPYIAKLLRAGHKVAICEQVSETPGRGGLMERRVVEVLTPGTTLQEGMLDARRNNYLVALRWDRETLGFAAADITTGEFVAADLRPEDVTPCLETYRPSEILLGEDQVELAEMRELLGSLESVYRSVLDAWRFRRERCERRLREHFGLATLAAWDLEDLGPGLAAAGALLEYAGEQKQSELRHIRRLRRWRPGQHLVLDAVTLRHLEVLEPLLGKDERTTLLHALDGTATSMGARRLRKALAAPLMDREAIRRRHEAIGVLAGEPERLAQLRELLRGIQDLERLAARIHTDRATPRDLAALRASLGRLPGIQEKLGELGEGLPYAGGDLLEDVRQLLERALVEDPPAQASELGIIREGFDERLDEIRRRAAEGRRWIASLQETERRATGIPSLKVGFNKVFGYYLEVTRAHLSKVPPHYIRKQTLVGAERFVTPELKEKEEDVLGAEEAERKRQQELLKEILEALRRETPRLLAVADEIAELDLLAGWAHVARREGYTKPRLLEEPRIRIVEGRHPVVERFVGRGAFVPNDVTLDTEGRQIQILTGPNMAGKSTFLRQVGLICLMAQAGCWVPAREAELGLVDRIFTRVGASDNIALGQSTFLVEMVETSRILQQATSRSLVLLDEIGRGTSTYDGLALAWAVAEELRRDPQRRPMVLFATHFHELTHLAHQHEGFVNLNVLVKEWNDEVVFLRKVVEGAADRSYGIHVARLAGLPEHVLERARRILEDLEARALRPLPDGEVFQLPLFQSGPPRPRPEREDPAAGEVLDELRRLDPDDLSPRQAWEVLRRLRDRLLGSGGEGASGPRC